MKKEKSKYVLKFMAGALIVGASAMGLSTLQQNNNNVGNANNHPPMAYSVPSPNTAAVPVLTALKQVGPNSLEFNLNVTPDTAGGTKAHEEVTAIKNITLGDGSAINANYALKADFKKGSKVGEDIKVTFTAKKKDANLIGHTYTGGLKFTVTLAVSGDITTTDKLHFSGGSAGSNIVMTGIKVNSSSLWLPASDKNKELTTLDWRYNILSSTVDAATTSALTIDSAMLTGKGIKSGGVDLKANITRTGTDQTYVLPKGTFAGSKLESGTYSDWKITIKYKFGTAQAKDILINFDSFSFGQQTQAHSKNKTLTIVSSVLGVAVIILLALIGWILYNNRKQIASKK